MNLTPSAQQERILDALIELGCNKLISRETGIPLRTVENHIARALLRTGAKNRVQLAIQWDRYRRSNAT